MIDWHTLNQATQSKVTPKIGERRQVGPWRVRFVREDFPMDGWYVVRDGPRGWAAMLSYHAHAQADRFYRRLIITLAVWGLAKFNAAVLPTWRDVPAIVRVVNWIKGR